MKIYCCGCHTEVEAVRVTGERIYPHRPDLYEKVFYLCQACRNYVGTHADGRPLGTIPTPEIRKARNRVHATIDPLWKERKVKRGKLYAIIRKHFGLTEYHTAEINTVEFAEQVIEFAKSLTF